MAVFLRANVVSINVRDASMDGLINRSFGQYTIIEPIRQGGMSTVYKAYQESLDRYVAIKVLAHNSEPQFVARFKREARAIAQLQHPNILPIYDSNEQDGMLYLVMQYIENGTTIGDQLDERRRGSDGRPWPRYAYRWHDCRARQQRDRRHRGVVEHADPGLQVHGRIRPWH